MHSFIRRAIREVALPGLVAISAAAAVTAAPPPCSAPAPAAKLTRWDSPLRGAVYSGYYGNDVAADLDAARGYGVRLLRLFFPRSIDAPNDAEATAAHGAMTGADLADWDSGYFESDRFEQALRTLDATILEARQRGMHVVISPGLVPGSHGKGPVRWRLFRREHWHDAFAAFWRRLAERYRDDHAVVGYLLLNEPGFESTLDLSGDDLEALQRHHESVRGTAADLNLLYRRTVRAIRTVDAHTPVIIQPGQWGRPHALRFLEPLDDPHVIYCVHWYGPWLYTTWRMNRGRWSYPGPAPSNFAGDPEQPGELMEWAIDTLRRRMADPIRAWQAQHGIPSSRIYVGEFGADRRVAGAERWLADMLTVIEENGWHWTWYMFREREWNGMDQELGAQAGSKRSGDTPAMRVIRERLRR